MIIKQTVFFIQKKKKKKSAVMTFVLSLTLPCLFELEKWNRGFSRNRTLHVYT